MNRLVIIGNGFDMAHGLKTSYKDFIEWYWEQRLDALLTETKPVSADCLCELKISDAEVCPSWFYFFHNQSYRNLKDGSWKYAPVDIIRGIVANPDDFSVTYSTFFSTILKSLETKGWVDIENDYYQLLKKNIDKPEIVNQLNKELAYLQDKLVEYLNTQQTDTRDDNLFDAIIDKLNPQDFSTEGSQKAFDNIGLDRYKFDKGYYSNEEKICLFPTQIMLLSFNYTNTIYKYNNFNIVHNFIHGELSNRKNIIFGYGDDLDKDYQDILDKNDKELLRNIKSEKYLETNCYRKMLEFIQSAPFQVYIMGHSCGNSDRTLLNTVFEHENCVSIKPFYHKWDDDSDNYLELVQNISRNFTNMKMFRDRVVNKTQCETM